MAANGFDVERGLRSPMAALVRPETIPLLQEDDGVLPNQQAVLPNQQAVLNLHLPAAAPDVQDQAVNAAGVHPVEALRPGAHDQAVNAAAAAAEALPVEALVHDQAVNAAAAEVRPGVHDQAVNAAVVADVRPGEGPRPGVQDQAVNVAVFAAEELLVEALRPGAHNQVVNAVAAEVRPVEALRPGAHDQAVNAAAAAAAEALPVEALVHDQAVNAAAAEMRPGVHDQAVNAAVVADVRPGEGPRPGVQDQAVNVAVFAAEELLVEALRPGAHNQVVNAVAAEVRPVEAPGAQDQAVNAAAEEHPFEALRSGAHDQAVKVEVRPGEEENANLKPQEVMDQRRNGPPIDDIEYATEVEDSRIAASSSRGTKRRHSGEPPLEERFNGEMLEFPEQYVASYSPSASTSSGREGLKIINPALEAHSVLAESTTKNKQRAEQAHPDQ